MKKIEWVWKYHAGHKDCWYAGRWYLRDGKHDDQMFVKLRSKVDSFIPGGNPVSDMEATLWYQYGAGLTKQFIDDMHNLCIQHKEKFLSIAQGKTLIQTGSIG